MSFESLLESLEKAESNEERDWLTLSVFLESLPRDLTKLVWAAAIPHWFDEELLKVLCPQFEDNLSELFIEFQSLPFVEPFPQRGLGAFNIHELTRNLLLMQYHRNRKEELVLLSRRAKSYFQTLKNEALGSFGTFSQKLDNRGIVKKESMMSILNWVDENWIQIIGLDPRIEFEILYHQLSINYDKAVNSIKILGEAWKRESRFDLMMTIHEVVIEQSQFNFSQELAIGWSRFHQAFATGILIDAKSAVQIYEKILESNYKDNRLVANVKVNLAETLVNLKHDDPKAEAYAKEALSMFRSIRERNGEANALRVLAQVERGLWRIESAKSNLTNALSISREQKQKINEAAMINEFGLTEYQLDDYIKAKQSFQQSLLINRSLAPVSKLNEARDLRWLGETLIKLGEFGEAKRFLQESLDLYKSLGYTELEYICFKSLGTLAAEEENYPLAFDMLNQVKDKFIELNQQRDAALALLEIGMLYEKDSKSYNKAIEIYSRAYEINQLPESLLCRASAYTKIKEYEKAAYDVQVAEELGARGPQLILALTELLIYQGVYEKAILNLQQLLGLTTFNPSTYFFIGIALWGLGQKDKAFEEFQKCLTHVYLSSNIKVFLNNIERLKSERKELNDIDNVIDLFKSWKPTYK